MKTLSGLRVSVQRGVLVVGQAVSHEIFRGGNSRGLVDHFSDRSRNRLGRFIRNALCDYPVFGTLTYPPGFGSSPDSAKRDLKCFLERVRRATVPLGADGAGNRGKDGVLWSVIWWMEFTGSGRIHFHFCSTHQLPKEWLSRTWYDVVGSENEYHQKAGTRIEFLHGSREQMRAYATKYAAKSEQKDTPDGMDSPGRFWGVWGCRETVEAATFVPEHAFSVDVIAQSINNLTDTIEKMVITGDLVQQDCSDDNVKVYFFTAAWVHAMLSMRVEKLALVSEPQSSAYMIRLRAALQNSGAGSYPDPSERVFAGLGNAALTSLGILDHADRLHSATQSDLSESLYDN